MSENLVYEQLFRMINSFEKQADKYDSQGKRSEAERLRSYFRRKVGLNTEQEEILKKTAKDFLSETEKLEKLSARIVKNEESTGIKRKNSPQFKKLKEYRENLSLTHLQRIEDDFGSAEFAKFSKFIEKDFAAKLSLRSCLKTLIFYFLTTN